MQSVSPESGRIQVSATGWALRICTVSAIAIVVAITLYTAILWGDPLVVYSTIMPLHSICVYVAGWFFFKSPNLARFSWHRLAVHKFQPLVSVIIPVYNQKQVIEQVIDAISCSTYKNIEVVAVNDGSTDGTVEVLDKLRYPGSFLQVVHQPKNGGKRRAVASGFRKSKGDIIVLIDSDSIVGKDAIEEMLKAFALDKEVGGAVGHIKVLNNRENALTKSQDAWYDYAFNVHKAAESYWGSVTCISGCLAAYRRDVIGQYIPFWEHATVQYSDDREMTAFVMAGGSGKQGLQSISQYHYRASQYDDSEDRMLTANALVGKWKTVYVPTALCWTEVPSTWRTFLRQQQRWKKGFLRTNFFVSSFFYQERSALMSLIYYTEFISAFSMPFMIVGIMLWEPLVLGKWIYPVYMLSSLVLQGLAGAADYHFRDRETKNWLYKIPMNFMMNFVLGWLLFPAMWNFRKNKWLTR